MPARLAMASPRFSGGCEKAASCAALPASCAVLKKAAWLAKVEVQPVADHVAHLIADPAAGDELVAQFGSRLVREFGAVRAGERGIFDHLDRRLGVAHPVAEFRGDRHHVRPGLARGRGDLGDRLAGEAGGGVLALVVAGGQAQHQRSKGGGECEAGEAMGSHGFRFPGVVDHESRPPGRRGKKRSEIS
jgi:hypothetical protein